MKKLLMILSALLLSIGANAQFQEGKGYLGASLTGLDLHYNSEHGFQIGAEAKAGYLFTDNWMMLGQAGYMHYGSDDMEDQVTLGVGLRYYIIQNGLYLGVNGKFLHANKNYNDLMPGLEIGYAFFINRSVTIEPAVYYDQSFKSSDYSTIGFKVGLGVYLFDD